MTDFTNELNRVLLALSNHENVILTGDLNARHQAWGDRLSNAKGNIVVNETISTNLQCVNNGAITHLTNNSTGSVIDVTFTNISSNSRKWTCHQVHLGGSKHFPITIEITNTGKKPNYFIPKQRLAQEISKNNIDMSIANWTYNFFSKRTPTLGNHTVEITSGLPQGSCLSPTLFNIYTAQLHEINDTQTQLFQFADDLAIISTNTNKITAAHNLQNKIEELQISTY
ncbi:uncharacterized protein LOC118749851 [Rhagoletis pomonella]|uniref:uncharacterized protein LOC118749851 n=1 Tax=Rhagoletis pomonella TaxID=28610 RepID=UPI00177EB456|nr:uncharacterized protein LOC118749851 [Rhagoletis pomonella]